MTRSPPTNPYALKGRRQGAKNRISRNNKAGNCQERETETGFGIIRKGRRDRITSGVPGRYRCGQTRF